MNAIRLVLTVSVASAALLSSCTLPHKQVPSEAEVQAEPPKPPLYAWEDVDSTGHPAIKISLAEQKAYVFRGGKDVAWTMLASGVASHRTPTGTFTVLEKKEKKESNLYGIIVDAEGDVVNWDAKNGVSRVPPGGRFVGAPMPYWMRLTSGGVGMHAGEIPNPGKPASHGCIRLPIEMAQKLFSVVEVGTTVTISGQAPD